MAFTAIVTKFIGPSNVEGSRYKAETTATLGNGKKAWLTIDANHALDYSKNHDLVAKTLAAKLGWYGVWVKGETETGNVYVRLPYGEGVNNPNSAAFVIA
jgi:hypothetical protein